MLGVGRSLLTQRGKRDLRPPVLDPRAPAARAVEIERCDDRIERMGDGSAFVGCQRIGIDRLPAAGMAIELGARGGQQEQPRQVCPGRQLADQLSLELRPVSPDMTATSNPFVKWPSIEAISGSIACLLSASVPSRSNAINCFMGDLRTSLWQAGSIGNHSSGA